MRLRTLGLVAVLVLAASLLSACRTNVGIAARVDGYTLKESTVNSYVTSSAQSTIPLILGGDELTPKSFVVDTVITERLLDKWFRALPGSSSEARISTAFAQARGSMTNRKFALQLTSGLDQEIQQLSSGQQGFSGYRDTAGYSDSLYELIARTIFEYSGIIGEQSQGVDIITVLDRLHFPVSVNPRYGKWDATGKSLSGHGSPSFLALQPAA